MLVKPPKIIMLIITIVWFVFLVAVGQPRPPAYAQTFLTVSMPSAVTIGEQTTVTVTGTGLTGTNIVYFNLYNTVEVSFDQPVEYIVDSDTSARINLTLNSSIPAGRYGLEFEVDGDRFGDASFLALPAVYGVNPAVVSSGQNVELTFFGAGLSNIEIRTMSITDSAGAQLGLSVNSLIIDSNSSIRVQTGMSPDIAAGNATINILNQSSEFELWHRVGVSVAGVPTATPVPTAPPAPTATPVPTLPPEPTATAVPTVTPEPTFTPVPDETFPIPEVFSVSPASVSPGESVEFVFSGTGFEGMDSEPVLQLSFLPGMEQSLPVAGYSADSDSVLRVQTTIGADAFEGENSLRILLRRVGEYEVWRSVDISVGAAEIVDPIETPTVTVTFTPTATPLLTSTPTETSTPSVTPSSTVTVTGGIAPAAETPTVTGTPTATPTETTTPSPSPTGTLLATPTPSPSFTPSPTTPPGLTLSGISPANVQADTVVEMRLDGSGFERVESLDTIVINGMDAPVIDVIVVSDSQIDVIFEVPADIGDGIYDVTFDVMAQGDEKPLQSRILLQTDDEPPQDLVMTATAEIVATASAVPTSTPTPDITLLSISPANVQADTVVEMRLDGNGFERVESLDAVMVNGVEAAVIDVILVSESQIDVVFEVPADIGDGIYDVIFDMMVQGDKRSLQSRILLLAGDEPREDLVMTATAEIVATASAVPTSTPVPEPTRTPLPAPEPEEPSVPEEAPPAEPDAQPDTDNGIADDVAPIAGALAAGTAAVLWTAVQFVPRPGIGRQGIRQAMQQADRTVRLSQVKLKPKGDRGKQSIAVASGSKPWAAEFSLTPEIDRGEQRIEVDGPLIDEANETNDHPSAQDK